MFKHQMEAYMATLDATKKACPYEGDFSDEMKVYPYLTALKIIAAQVLNLPSIKSD